MNKVGIGHVGGLGDEAVITLGMENTFLFEISSVRKTACDEKPEVKFIEKPHWASL
jgi:hypothetical protein